MKNMFETLGENVEPLELEEAALRSSLIRQIVVIGQVYFYLYTPFVFMSSIIVLFSWLASVQCRINAALELSLFQIKKRC